MFGNGKVFISHTHEDNAACAPVLAALDAWQVDYWIDLAQLSAGLELLGHIQRGLLDRDIFIRICTPAMLASTWTAQEQMLARTMRAPNRGLRRMINLIVKPGYIVQPNEVNDITIDTTRQPEVVWMRQLREALEIPSRERRVSRRAVLGVGITSLAALGGLGLAGKLLFFTPPEPNRYLPIGHHPTATPLPGTSRIRWRFSIYPQPFFGVRTNIALSGQTVITAGNSTLTAVNGTDGKFLWIQRQYDINTDVPPLVVGNSIYVTYREPTYATDSETDAIYLAAFSVADGSQQWRQLVATILVLANDNVPSASAITLDAAATTAYVRVNQTLHACDVKTRTVRWSQSAGTANVEVDEVLPAPTVTGNAVYAVLGDHKLHAFAATSGAPLWPAPFATALPIHTQPVVASGLVYTGADGGWCYALDAATGTIRWKAQLLNPKKDSGIDLTRFTSLGLTLHANVLYISGGFPFSVNDPTPAIHLAFIQALDPTTGKILWTSSPNLDLNLRNSSLFRTSPVIAGNSILMASALYSSSSASITILYALNPQTGKTKWNLQVPGIASASTDNEGVPSAPVVSGDTLYLISGNEMLYALSYGDNG
jgi:outer membrane protein assembly factor BamB